MDYYQGIVTDYLRADRAMFLNMECCIQLDAGSNPDASPGRHWYCDVVAVNLRDEAIFLCEITYSSTLEALIKRLNSWHTHWNHLCAALVRDLHVSASWPVRPWVFIPDERRDLFAQKLAPLGLGNSPSVGMPQPKVTSLEEVVPWKYRSWNHIPN
ncbi:hypothetical protein ACV229_31305 [Burkholderia sp. MR1-5-21]